jgi:hypothetical protein
MASPVEVKLILCDSAVADPAGKVHMLGAGWSLTGVPAAPHAIVLLGKVPWDRTNQQLHLHLELVDGDGQPVTLPDPNGSPVAVGQEADLEVGRPPGIPPGSMLNAAFALSVPSLHLQPGRYTWRLNFADILDSESFTVQGK